MSEVDREVKLGEICVRGGDVGKKIMEGDWESCLMYGGENLLPNLYTCGRYLPRLFTTYCY